MRAPAHAHAHTHTCGPRTRTRARTPLAGTWSPTRPGVFFTIKMDGTMDVWDLFYKHNEPTLTVEVNKGMRAVFLCRLALCMLHQNCVLCNTGPNIAPFMSYEPQVSDQPLTAFAAHESGSTVAVGTADGSTTVLQLSAVSAGGGPCDGRLVGAGQRAQGVKGAGRAGGGGGGVLWRSLRA